MAKHRKHTNSTEEKMRIAQAMDKKLPIPKHVFKQARPIFLRILDIRAVADWENVELAEHDLEIAGYMANLMFEMERELQLLHNAPTEERPVHIKNVNAFTSQLMNYRRTLNLHQARDGSARRTQQRYEQNKETEKKLKLAAVDGELLA